VIHVIDPVEAGQLRGVSKLAPAIVKLFLLDQYDDAELDRKKVAAMYAMFVTSPAPENPLLPAEDDDTLGGFEISPGQVVRLDPGEDVTVGASLRIQGRPMSHSNTARCCRSPRRWAFLILI
jgi:capsid protein